MGYLSSFHLIDVKIKDESVPAFKHALVTGGSHELAPIQFFLELLVIDSAGFIYFKASKDGVDPYVPDDEGTVPVCRVHHH